MGSSLYRSVSVLLLFVTALVLAGCGGGAGSTPTVTVRPKGAGSGNGTNSKTNGNGTGKPKNGGGTGNLEVTVVYAGSAPQSKQLYTTSGDPFCASVASKAIDDSLIVKDGKLKNFVMYRSASPGGNYPPPSNSVPFTNRNCTFQPRIQLVQVGQTMVVGNDDNTTHNTHTNPNQNNPLNVSIKKNQPVNLVYEVAETAPVRVKCDIHNWMFGYHVVVDHPFADISGDDGKITINNLPSGANEFVFWHEKLKTVVQEIDIKADATTKVTVEVKGQTITVKPE